MPYPITEKDGKYCVNGKCYETRADALKYQRALEANVPDAHKALDDVIKGLETEEQQRWFFANNPEYAHGGSGQSAQRISGFSADESNRIHVAIEHIKKTGMTKQQVRAMRKAEATDAKYADESLAKAGADKDLGYHRKIDPADARAKANEVRQETFHNPRHVAALNRLADAHDRAQKHATKLRLYDHILSTHDFKTPKSKELYASPKPAGLFSRVKDGITVKSINGHRFMFIVTSNSYKDRENETLARKALQGYVDAAWAVEDKCLPNNPLLFWHDGEPIGDIVWTDTAEDGVFLLEVAKERPNKIIKLTTKGTRWEAPIKTIWDALEEGTYKWGASHGFRYSTRDFEDGVYKQIAKFETSTLPLDAAANPFTFSGVIDDMNKDSVLEKLLGVPGAAGKFRKGVRAIKQELDKQGVEHKAAATEEETAIKGMLDNAQAVLDKAFARLTDKVPEGFSAEVLHQLHLAIGDNPDNVDNAQEDAADNGADDATEKPDPNKADMMSKQLKLFERLIQSQEALTEDGIATRDAMVKVAKAVSPLVDLPDAVKALETRLAAVEKKFGGAPRRAAIAEETVVEDKALTEKAAAMADKLEELFPGSGVHLKPAANGNGR